MKILKVTDFHDDPAWIDESDKCVDRIVEVGIKEKVDAITSSGDWFNKAVMATNKNKWKRLLDHGRRLREVCPVYFIYGTPSHDPDGIYESYIDIGWKEISIGKHEVIGDLLIMGIQELTPSVLMGHYPDLSKQEINAEQYNLVNKLIDKYYAPLASSHSGKILFLGHGHVSGTQFKADQKPRSTDFMYTEEMLSRISADYYQFGHIHLPQQFKTISGGYGGSAHMTWGDIGFKPGFDVYDTETGKSEKFDYGELERQKITVEYIGDLEAITPNIKKNVNLWVDIKCDKAFADQLDCEKSLEQLKSKTHIGPLSKITCNIQHTENIRVDVEEYEACNTLEDLYKIYDPNVTESILLKVSEAQDATDGETQHITPHNFEFLDLYLKGSKAGLENGVEEIKIDFGNFNTGANLIIGENGTGKSFNLGFCTPFSVHLPTGADLKSLFELKDSQILRKFKDGENIITQKIMIDPTLAAPTAKYYMDINGTAVETVTGNKSLFDDAVSELFGSIKMFMTCAFRGQKENSNYPSLENAKETDLRKIFTELSGISRAPMKEYAHDKVTVMKKDIELDIREIETLESVVEDRDEIEKAISDNELSLSAKKGSIGGETLKLGLQKDKLSLIESVITENKNIDSQVSTISEEAQNLTAELGLLEHELRGMNVLLDNVAETRSDLEGLKKQQTEHTTASAAYFEAQGAFNKLVSDYQEDKNKKDSELGKVKNKADILKNNISDLTSSISKNRYEKTGIENKNVLINKPCEHCNKLSTNAKVDIAANIENIKELDQLINWDISILEAKEEDLQKLRDGYKIIQKSIPPYPETPDTLPELKYTMDSLKYDSEKLKSLETIITGLKSSEDKKIDLENTISQNQKRIKEISGQITALKTKIKPVNKISYETLKVSISDIEKVISDNTGEIGRLTAEIEALRAQIKKNVEREEKIKTLREKCGKSQGHITEWEGIEKAFSPKGIEALELSLIAPVINREANEFLNKYQPRYSVEIITQDFNSKNQLSEKFKILVHDSKASDVKSLVIVSGGQAVWATSALREAINSSVIKRTGRNYMYGIIDEQDGALDNNVVSDFYSMINDSLTGKKKLISVSHNIEAISTISNVVEVTDFFVKGE